MDNTMSSEYQPQPPQPQMDDEDVRVDDNVDELFLQKMKMLEELGICDTRLMAKAQTVHSLTVGGPAPTHRARPMARGAVLGRPDFVSHKNLVEFKGEYKEGAEELTQMFKPIENSGLKWSLPIRRRSPTEMNDRSDHLFGDNIESSSNDRRNDISSDDIQRRLTSTEDLKLGLDSLAFKAPMVPMAGVQKLLKARDAKAEKLDEFFKSRKTNSEVKTTETIVDIEAFIKDCNKKAEKAKPVIADIEDIDDFISIVNQRLNEIYEDFDSKNKKFKRK